MLLFEEGLQLKVSVLPFAFSDATYAYKIINNTRISIISLSDYNERKFLQSLAL